MARSARRPAPAPARRPMPTHAAPAKPAPPAPAAAPPAPMQPASGGGGMLSGIGSTIVQGMAFGTGSAIAHQAVGAVVGSFGGGSSPAPAENAAPAAPAYAAGAMPAANDACSMDKTMYYDCLKQNNGDNQACHFLYEQLKDCQQNKMQFA